MPVLPPTRLYETWSGNMPWRLLRGENPLDHLNEVFEPLQVQAYWTRAFYEGELPKGTAVGGVVMRTRALRRRVHYFQRIPKTINFPPPGARQNNDVRFSDLGFARYCECMPEAF